MSIEDTLLVDVWIAEGRVEGKGGGEVGERVRRDER